MKLLFYLSLPLVTLCLSPVLAISEPAQIIKIGVLLPLTGEVAAHGNRLIAPIESTKQPGIEFVFEDDACQSAKAITGYENLRRQGIKYFLGPCCSASMKTVAPRFASNDELSFATCPISEEIYSISHSHVLTTFYSIEADADFIASSLYNSGKRKVVLIFQDTEFGRLQERSFKAKFKGEVVDVITYNQPDVSELRLGLIKLKRTDFDAVYIPQLEPFLLGILKEMGHLGIRGKPVYSIFSSQLKEVVTMNGHFSDGLTYSYPDIPLQEDAVTYFPKLGAQMLVSALRNCNGDYKCTREYLQTHYTFSDRGVLKGDIKLRIIKNGEYLLKDGK